MTRIQSPDENYYYGLGLPASSARIAIRRIPWQVARHLLLYIFSVDARNKVTRYSWKEMRKAQSV